MDKNKRKQIEAKLSELFTQSATRQKTPSSKKTGPVVVKVIRKRKGEPNRYYHELKCK